MFFSIKGFTMPLMIVFNVKNNQNEKDIFNACVNRNFTHSKQLCTRQYNSTIFTITYCLLPDKSIAANTATSARELPKAIKLNG